MPGFKDHMKAIREHTKLPTWMKLDPKGFVRATKKAFSRMLSCVKHQKDEDNCPGLPEVKVSYVDEDIPESLASRSRISLTDSESEACPAEADLGPRSDSLEGIPEMLEAESLPSLMEHDEEKESAGKGKDGEKDSESGPTGADSGPRSDRVSEPQGSPSDEKRGDQQFDGDKVKSSQTEENLHLLCRKFPNLSNEQQEKFADAIAARHLYLMLHHFLKSEETVCNHFMYAVFASPKCNLNTCLNVFVAKLNENQMDDSEELSLARLNALRGIKNIVMDHSNIQDLKDWLHYHFVTLSNVLVDRYQPKEPGIGRKGKTYLVPGEAIDILAILLLRLDLVHSMKSDKLRR